MDRKKKSILNELDEDKELTVDDREEIVKKMRIEIQRQRKCWKYSYGSVLVVLLVVLVYGLFEQEWGILPNVVRVLTIGHYNYSMAIPSLSVCIVTTSLTLLYVLYPWIRFILPLAVSIPYCFTLFWCILRLTKWKAVLIGIPMVSILFSLLPAIAYYVEKENRSIWSGLENLEDLQSRYKSVCIVCIMKQDELVFILCSHWSMSFLIHNTIIKIPVFSLLFLSSLPNTSASRTILNRCVALLVIDSLVHIVCFLLTLHRLHMVVVSNWKG